MSEYIKREDAERAIDDELDRIDHVPNWVFEQLEKSLDDVPTADVVEVVRCRDCKHCKKSYNYGYYYCEHFGICKIWDEGVEGDRYYRAWLHPSSYCSYGERKGKDNE